MPHRKPLKPGPAGASRLAAAAIIGSSFTLVGAGVAILIGLLPERTMLLGVEGVDAAVLLLFVPLCALTLAILGEAARASFVGRSHSPARIIQSNPLEPWRPGRGEG